MAKRFDIAPLGASLLEDSNKRREDSKDDDKSVFAQLAIQLGVGIGNRILSKRADQFNQNADIMASKAKNKTDYDNKLYVKQTRDAIELSRKGMDTFFADSNYERILARRMEGVDLATLSPSGKNTMAAAARVQATKLGAEQASLFTKAEQAAQKVIDPEDFQSRIDLSNTRPKNVGGWIADKMTDLFGGKSQQEVDNEAIENLRISGELPGKALDLFKSSYDKSLNWSATADLVEKVYDTKPPESTFTTTTQQMADGTLLAITKEQRLNTDGTHKGKSEVTKENLGNYAPDGTASQDFLNDINKNARFLDLAREQLSTEAIQVLAQTLNEQGVNPAFFDKPEQMTLAFKTLGVFLDKKENLKDEFKNDLYIELMKVQLDKVLKIDIAIIMGERDPNKQAQMFKDLAAKFINNTTETRDAIEKFRQATSYNDLVG